MKHKLLAGAVCFALILASGTWAADPDLIFYYSFDNFASMVPDHSGKGHNGTVVGDVTPDAGGKRGGAARFANQGYIDLDGPSFPQSDIPVDAITLCAWVKVKDTGDHHAIFNARASDGTWLIHPELRSNGQFRWLLRAYGQTTIFDMRVGEWIAGEWLHYAGVYSAADSVGILYINGEVAGVEGAIVPHAQIAGDWNWGARVGKNIDDLRPFTGLMDDLCLYKRALSRDEVKDIMEGDGLPDVTHAMVSINPETLNSDSRGIFTAFIDLPDDYSETDIIISTVKCGGAPALRGTMSNDGRLIVKFDREDLDDVPTGDAVELIVTGELIDGTVFGGSDTVRVIEPTKPARRHITDDFNRPDSDEVGNGWSVQTDGTITVEIVNQEVFISGTQGIDWQRSGIFRAIEDQTEVYFDFLANDSFNVHVQIDDTASGAFIDVYAPPGGSFFYASSLDGSWPGWTGIPDSNMIPDQYNTLGIEKEGDSFTVYLNGTGIEVVENQNLANITRVLMSSDAAAGTTGSLHIDNVSIGNLKHFRGKNAAPAERRSITPKGKLSTIWGRIKEK
jgi:hypothetical protein